MHHLLVLLDDAVDRLGVALARGRCRLLDGHGPRCAGRPDHLVGGYVVDGALTRRRARLLAALDRAAEVGAAGARRRHLDVPRGGQVRGAR